MSCLQNESCAKELEWSLFHDSEETIHSAEINDTSYESQADFHGDEAKKNFKKKIKMADSKKMTSRICHSLCKHFN